MRQLLHAAIAIAILAGYALAQNEPLPVTLILPDGTESPFDISHHDGEPRVYYTDASRNTFASGIFVVSVGGSSQQMPIDLITRADLVDPGSETIWRFTLKDGRMFDGAVQDSGARLFLTGTNQFGTQETLNSRPRNPDAQPFIGVIFDETAATQSGGASSQQTAHGDADTVNLRNGDVLSGDILTTEFVVQASYGTLSFAQDQLASISIESQNGRTDQVVLDVGDRVSGVLKNESIEIALTSGATVTLEKGNIGSITFAAD